MHDELSKQETCYAYTYQKHRHVMSTFGGVLRDGNRQSMDKMDLNGVAMISVGHVKCDDRKRCELPDPRAAESSIIDPPLIVVCGRRSSPPHLRVNPRQQRP
eukprot:scaffold134724_cov56-Attheya_sp.AAC.4